MRVKYLIIRFSSIGDIVLTTPVVRTLKNQVEGAEIHYLTKKDFAKIIESNSYVDKVHVLEDNITDTIKILKQEKFDYIIDLHNNLRSFRIKKSLQALSFTFNKLNIKKYLAVRLKKIDALPDIHIVDRYMQTLKLFDIKNDNKGLDFFIDDTDTEFYAQLPEIITKNKYVAFVIGAKHYTKRLPDDKIKEICNNIDVPVVLLGGKDDAEKGKHIAEDSGKHVFNFCGKLNLNQSAFLVKKAEFVISHDTGLMHIAAAFDKKIISVWGNTIPEFGMYPYMTKESYIIEVRNLKCRPCSKIGYNKCPKKHFRCMNDIDSSGIINILNAQTR